MCYKNLSSYGLSSRFEQEALLYPELNIARVTEQHRTLYKIMTEQGECTASVSGKFVYDALDNTAFPVVGDWVMVNTSDDAEHHVIIHHVLQRKSLFERKAAGTECNVQIVATNIDTIFICMSLNADFNLRRLERYLAIAWNSRAKPVIVLTKSDLCADLNDKLVAIETLCFGVDILITTIIDDVITVFAPYFKKQDTAVFLGSSGVGKSSLINKLLGQEILQTQAVGSDDSGRHTTTHRQLFKLPQGGIVIDTPGMRELQLDSGDLSKTFVDLEELATQCKFRNCTHVNEHGCAILQAITNNELSASRLENYRKLEREIQYGGLNTKQLEHAKINNMFGSLNRFKKFKQTIRKQNKHN